MTIDQLIGTGVLLLISGSFIVWVAKMWINKTLDGLKDIEHRVHSLSLEVASNYVTKYEHSAHIQRIEQTQIDQYARIEVKLDKIFDMVERKADK